MVVLYKTPSVRGSGRRGRNHTHLCDWETCPLTCSPRHEAPIGRVRCSHGFWPLLSRSSSAMSEADLTNVLTAFSRASPQHSRGVSLVLALSAVLDYMAISMNSLVAGSLEVSRMIFACQNLRTQQQPVRLRIHSNAGTGCLETPSDAPVAQTSESWSVTLPSLTKLPNLITDTHAYRYTHKYILAYWPTPPPNVGHPFLCVSSKPTAGQLQGQQFQVVPTPGQHPRLVGHADLTPAKLGAAASIANQPDGTGIITKAPGR